MSSGEKVTFAEAFSEVSRGVKKFKQNQYDETGSHPIIDQGQELIAGYSDEEQGLFTDVPAIVFGDHTRCVKYVDVPFFAGADGVKILKPKLSDNTRFWWHALKATSIENLGYSRHFKLLKTAVFRLYGESHQTEIVTALDSVLEGIDQASQQIAQLDQLVKSRFVEMFGDPDGNPHGYEKGVLGDVLSVQPSNGLYKPQKDYVQDGSGNPIIRIDSFRREGPNFARLKRLKCSETELTRFGVHENDIVINRVNSVGCMGKTMLVSLIPEPTVFESNMMRLHADESRMSPRFMCEQMTTEYSKAYFEKNAKRAIGQASINQTDVRKLPVLIPPLAVQHAYLDLAAQVDKTRAIAQQQIDKLQTLYDSLAQDYFA